MDGFEKRTGLKKQKVIKSALALFKQKGINRTSMDEIAAHSGVSKLSIYKYFENKQKLITIILSGTLEDICSQLKDISQKKVPFDQKIRLYLALRKKIMEKGLNIIMAEAKKTYRSINTGLDEKYKETVSFFYDLVKEGRKSGHINKDVSDEMLKLFMDILISYYQENPDFLKKINSDNKFYLDFLKLYWSPIMDIT